MDDNSQLEEPAIVYGTKASIGQLKGMIMRGVEQEESASVLQRLYIYLVKIKEEKQLTRAPKYRLSELGGILKSDSLNEISYDDMKSDYLKERYKL